MGLFGFLGSLFTGGMNFAASKRQNEANLQAQREANQTNMQIAQMNNEFNAAQFQKQLDYNYDMWNKQSVFQDKQLDKQNAFNESMMDKSNQFQLDMWNRNNEYNSASSQRARLEEAGLNPYMMMSGGSAGSATFSGGTSASSGSGSSPGALGVSPPTASPVSVSPVLGDVTGMTNAVQNMLQNVLASESIGAQVEKLNVDTLSQKIENKFKASNLMADLLGKLENTKNTRLRNIYQKIINDFAAENQIQDITHKKQQIALARMQENIYAADYAMKQMQVSAMPQQIKMQLAQGWANVMLTRVQADMTNEQIRKLGQDYLESVQRTEGIKLDNKQRSQCLDAFVQTARANAVRAWNNSGSDNPWKALESQWDLGWKRYLSGSNF